MKENEMITKNEIFSIDTNKGDVIVTVHLYNMYCPLWHHKSFHCHFLYTSFLFIHILKTRIKKYLPEKCINFTNYLWGYPQMFLLLQTCQTCFQHYYALWRHKRKIRKTDNHQDSKDYRSSSSVTWACRF